MPLTKLAELTGLTKLPENTNYIFGFTVLYFTLFILSPSIAKTVYPKYNQLSPSVRHGFDTHIISSVNAVLMCGLSIPMIWDRDLKHLDSYTPYAGIVISHCVGYFIWDIYITVRYFKYNGIAYFFHALTAFYVFSQALRPFMLNHAVPFIWFEASTLFVNINWYGTYVPGLVTPTIRQINGFILLLVFFIFRIVSGPYNGFFFFKDIATNKPENVPTIIVIGVLISYFVLVGLNFIWFRKMLKIAQKMLAKRT